MGSRAATLFPHRSDGGLLECLALRRDPDSSSAGRCFLCRDWGGGQYVPTPTPAYPPPRAPWRRNVAQGLWSDKTLSSTEGGGQYVPPPTPAYPPPRAPWRRNVAQGLLSDQVQVEVWAIDSRQELAPLLDPAPGTQQRTEVRLPEGHWPMFCLRWVTGRPFPLPTVPAVVSTGCLVSRRDPGSSIAAWWPISRSGVETPAFPPAPRGGWSPGRAFGLTKPSLLPSSSSSSARLSPPS